MDLENILKLDIENLSEKQYEALKKHTIDKLNEIIKYFENDELQKVYNSLNFSSSGDGWGDENYYIDFSYDNESIDLNDILYLMGKLKNINIERN